MVTYTMFSIFFQLHIRIRIEIFPQSRSTPFSCPSRAAEGSGRGSPKETDISNEGWARFHISLKGVSIYDVRNIFGFYPLPLVTVPLTQLISIFVCFSTTPSPLES